MPAEAARSYRFIGVGAIAVANVNELIKRNRMMVAFPGAGGANAVFEGASLILGGVVANVAGEEMGAVFFRSAGKVVVHAFKGALGAH